MPLSPFIIDFKAFRVYNLPYTIGEFRLERSLIDE